MALADLVAGTFAGVAICGVGHPFDTLKVLAQLQPDKYSNMVVAAKDTIKTHGLGGLYKGVSSPLIGNGLYNAVQFAVFARLKDVFTDGGRKNTVDRISQAAAVTGVFVAVVEGPQDLFKSQMQAQMIEPAAGSAAAAKPKYAGTFDCARIIVRERGFAGIFQGLQATIFRNFVGVGAYFAVYEAMRLKMAGDKPVSSLSAWHVLFAGGCGGCVSHGCMPSCTQMTLGSRSSSHVLCRHSALRQLAARFLSPFHVFAASATGRSPTRSTSSSRPSRQMPSTRSSASTRAGPMLPQLYGRRGA